MKVGNSGWYRERVAGKYVLYVDDDAALCRATVRLLRGAGILCLCATSHGEAALLVSLGSQLDLAVLDFHMPDGDVSQLIRRLRQLRPELPLVGTSGMDRRLDFADRNVTRFLPKPFDLEDLVQAAGWTSDAAAFPTDPNAGVAADARLSGRGR